MPWKDGKLLVWDATCPDTFAPSYAALATNEAGAVVSQAEVRKCDKYCHLLSSHTFEPVAIETSGAIGPRTRVFLKELGHRLRQVTGEVKCYTYLLQHLSVAIQRGNTASVLGTISHSANLEDFFSFLFFFFFFPSPFLPPLLLFLPLFLLFLIAVFLRFFNVSISPPPCKFALWPRYITLLLS